MYIHVMPFNIKADDNTASTKNQAATAALSGRAFSGVKSNDAGAQSARHGESSTNGGTAGGAL